MADYIELLGRLLVRGDIRAVTGLHIGAGSSGLTIGGLDNPVVRNPLDQQPYIPGSSLKGKLRSLAERAMGFDASNPDQTQRIGNVRIHVCRRSSDYASCPVCHLFGVPGELGHSSPTRLTVRDVFLDASSLAGARTDFLSTEVKWEASIDRITSAALPRQMERVPAGGLFRPFEMVCGLYAERSDHSDMDAEVERLRTLFEAMQLLEDDYLGGMGTRGSGKVRFEGIGLTVRKGAESEPIEVQSTDAKGPLIADIIAQQQSIIERVKQLLSAG